MIAFKALDIPYTFFDESHTNFSGLRGSWLQYERAAIDKRSDQSSFGGDGQFFNTSVSSSMVCFLSQDRKLFRTFVLNGFRAGCRGGNPAKKSSAT